MQIEIWYLRCDETDLNEPNREQIMIVAATHQYVDCTVLTRTVSNTRWERKLAALKVVATRWWRCSRTTGHANVSFPPPYAATDVAAAATAAAGKHALQGRNGLRWLGMPLFVNFHLQTYVPCKCEHVVRVVTINDRAQFTIGNLCRYDTTRNDGTNSSCKCIRGGQSKI